MDDSFDLTGYDTEAHTIDSTDADLASDMPESDGAGECLDSLEFIEDAEIPDIDIDAYEDMAVGDMDFNAEDIETLDTTEIPDEVGLAEGMDGSELSELLNDAESLDIKPFENETGDLQEESAEAHGWPVPTDRDKTELWQAGLHAIDDTVEALRDDLRGKGYTDEELIEQTVLPVRAGLMDELGRNIDGDLSNPYIMPDFNNSETPVEDMDQEGSALHESETGDLPDTPMVRDPEAPDNGNLNTEELSGNPGGADINCDTEDSQEEHSDTEVLVETAGNAEFGAEPAEVEEIEITSFENPEDMTESLEQALETIEILEPTEDASVDSITEEMQETEIPADTAPEIETLELAEDVPGDDIADEIPEAEIPDEVYEALTLPEQADDLSDEEEALEPQTDGRVEQNTDILPEIDLQAVYEGLDEYSFDNIDYAADPERLNGCLDGFTDSNWEDSTLEEKKEQIDKLKDYVEEVIRFKDPPRLEYYNSKNPRDYGLFDRETNTLRINTYSLEHHWDTPSNTNVAQEAADTVAHELWHAYQNQCALNPRGGPTGAIDYQRQYGLDHYIKPQHDLLGRCINYEDYADQLVEAEARAFAIQFRDRLKDIMRRY